VAEARSLLELFVAPFDGVVGDPFVPLPQGDPQLSAGEMGAQAAMDVPKGMWLLTSRSKRISNGSSNVLGSSPAAP
jgi:hypothetical protein